MTDSKTGTIEWFDAGTGVGSILPDDGGAPCLVDADALRACGIDKLEAGDRVQFRVLSDGGKRTAADLALIRAIQRWENEGGATP